MEKRIGNTIVEILERPLVRITWQGELDGDNLVEVVDWYMKETEGWGDLISINDCSRVTGIPASARKRATELSSERSRGTVISGASFPIRTVATMILKVMNMGRKSDNPTAFVSTPEEALAWARKRAAEIAKEAGR